MIFQHNPMSNTIHNIVNSNGNKDEDIKDGREENNTNNEQEYTASGAGSLPPGSMKIND